MKLNHGTRGLPNRRASHVLRTSAAVSAVVLVASGCTTAGPSQEARDGALFGTAHSQHRLFAEDSPWNVPIPVDPVLDPASDMIAAALGRDPRAFAQLYEFGIPVYEADANTPRYDVECTASWDGCRLEGQQIPIPAGAQPNAGVDGAMVVIDHSANRLYEFWQARKTQSGGWEASWGSSSELDGMGRDGSTGSGLSLLGGLVRTHEIRAGRIDHALAFASTLSCSDRFRYPARKTDGVSTAPDCLPQGARVQLDPGIDVDAIPDITPGEKAVAKALQTYGAYLRDSTAAQMAFSFEYPTSDADPYPLAAGFPWDYYHMPHIPWDRLRVLRQWDGR